jgi:hypothetical protein
MQNLEFGHNAIGNKTGFIVKQDDSMAVTEGKQGRAKV